MSQDMTAKEFEASMRGPMKSKITPVNGFLLVAPVVAKSDLILPERSLAAGFWGVVVEIDEEFSAYFRRGDRVYVGHLEGHMMSMPLNGTTVYAIPEDKIICRETLVPCKK